MNTFAFSRAFYNEITSLAIKRRGGTFFIQYLVWWHKWESRHFS